MNMTVTAQLRWIAFFLFLFAGGNFWYLYDQINDMTYDGKVVNFAGIVRGGTQRLVKLETAGGKKADELIARLDKISKGLVEGDKDLQLPKAEDPKFLAKMAVVAKEWTELKEKIQGHRINPAMLPELIALSEKYFETTNQAVAAAEDYAKSKVTTFERNQVILFGLNCVILGVFVFLIFGISKRIRGAITSLKGASEEMNVATMNVSTVSQSISNNAAKNASAFEEISSSVEELTAVVTQNANKSREASDLAKKTTEAASMTEDEIRKLIGAVDDIASGSKKIQEIISVMDEIAFQTNLLSLNASVEAARAGQHGRGFAVVAEAVRELAQKSGTAAKNVAELIKDSVRKSENGAKIGQSSRAALETVVGSIKKVAEAVSEISVTTTQQGQALSQISRAIVDADVSNQENAAKSEEAAASSEELTQQSRSLQSLTLDLAKLVGNVEERAQFHKLKQEEEPFAPLTIQPQWRPPFPKNVRVLAPKKPSTKGESAPSQNEDQIPFESAEVNGRVGTTNGF